MREATAGSPVLEQISELEYQPGTSLPFGFCEGIMEGCQTLSGREKANPCLPPCATLPTTTSRRNSRAGPGHQSGQEVVVCDTGNAQSQNRKTELRQTGAKKEKERNRFRGEENSCCTATGTRKRGRHQTTETKKPKPSEQAKDVLTTKRCKINHYREAT